jgi:methylenetetrahydrofolate dehydrogenase (NADP+) / methenyltetrahydrofolate cyclohydrolase
MIINGRSITADVLRTVREEVSKLPHTPVVRAVTVAPSPATLSYLRIKQKKAVEAGMTLETVELQEDAGTDEVIHAVLTEGADAVIVQLPLPASIDTNAVLQSIPLSKDADILSDMAKEKFRGGEGLLPPVVGAVKEILESEQVSVSGKNVYVLGKGQLVGVPVSQWLQARGAEVTILGKEDTDLSVLKEADIIVSGVGQAGLLKKEYLTEGVVLIDAGTSESAGSIVGDMDPDCSEIASVFTPVPGGVGPIAVAYLFKNVLQLMKGE